MMTTQSSNTEKDLFDLVVIGAGIYGIQAARTYLEVHPNHKVIVFEASGDIGGVWSTERVYDGFWTQTSLRILEFSDLPLRGIPASENYHGFFPAKYVASYLEKYVHFKIFNGQSLLSRIILHCTVDSLNRTEAGWTVHLRAQKEGMERPKSIATRRVIDATGLTSKPNIPLLPGQEVYSGQVLHSKDFAGYQKTSAYKKDIRTIAVVGGAKSAADIAYACAKAGHKVTWIIRRSGAGPAAFVSAEGSGPYNNSNESFYTRFTSHFLVSYFLDESKTWLGRFLYKTWLGRKVIGSVWKSINAKARGLANYDRQDGKENGFYNLKPDTEIFWQNDSTGICQRPDFFDTVAHNVKVYREDIDSLTADGLILANGTSLRADTVIYATGWNTSHPTIYATDQSEGKLLSLALSESTSQEDPTIKVHWKTLGSSAEQQILTRFPVLCEPPPRQQQVSDQMTPLRLYNGILTTNEDSIAFVGQMLLGNNFRVAEVQALYAVAAFDKALCLPTKQKMEKTIAETVAWDRLRYLAKGQQGNWMYWDMVPYTDYLLQDLGLTSHRHKSYWEDLFAPCYASDLRHLIKEYTLKYRTPGESSIAVPNG